MSPGAWLGMRGDAASSTVERLGTYDRTMAAATPSPTPNPDAMKFTLDVRLPAMINFGSAEAAAAADHAFASDVFAAGGVAAVFGVNDFVTITRVAGSDWEPIVAAVVAAAAEHL